MLSQTNDVVLTGSGSPNSQAWCREQLAAEADIVWQKVDRVPNKQLQAHRHRVRTTIYNQCIETMQTTCGPFFLSLVVEPTPTGGQTAVQESRRACRWARGLWRLVNATLRARTAVAIVDYLTSWSYDTPTGQTVPSKCLPQLSLQF